MRTGWPVLVLLSVVACSRDPQPAASAAAGKPAHASTPAAADSVAAVLQQGSAGPLTVRFVLQQQPVVGKSTSLQLELASSTPLDGVSVRVEGEALGLDAASSAKVVDLSDAGQPTIHTVAFTPQAPGLNAATVHVSTPGTDGRETVWAIPVLVDAAPAP